MKPLKTVRNYKIKSQKICFLNLLIGLFHTILIAQEEQIQWLSFEQLEDSLVVQPKKVFIDFYADWCSYCKKMNQVVFKNKKVINYLNREYYAVKMDVETVDTISYKGISYANADLGKKRKPVHQIPKLLASRKNYPFTLPALVLLNASFEITGRYFEYIPPEELYRILQDR